MLRYVGGKTRLAKSIAEQIYRHKTDQHRRYLEPFFGGGSMANHTVNFDLMRYAYDIHPDLILMYQALQNGWIPPQHISEGQYRSLKYAEPSALRAFVGFGSSFGGKWFGGYARDKTGKRDFTNESYHRIMLNRHYINDIIFKCKSYDEIKGVHSIDLVYADPPYQGTLGYNNSFDHTVFWNIMRDWSNTGATVLISEYTAPSDFEIVWETPYKTYGITLSDTKEKIERLFKWKG